MGRQCRSVLAYPTRRSKRSKKSAKLAESIVDDFHSRADALFARFEKGGGTAYIKQAVALDREALKLCPSGHPRRWASLNKLQRHLFYCHNQLGSTADIEEAIILAREALGLCPRGHPNRPLSLSGLAVSLSARYERLRVITDLDEAIILGRETLELHPRGHPYRSIPLNDLAADLSARGEQLEVMTDLNEAIALNQEALELRPAVHSDRPQSLNNIAVGLYARYKQQKELIDLDEAILLTREALYLRSQEHPNRSASLTNLAELLFARYNHLETMADLDEAIIAVRAALVLRPRGHPHRSVSLSDLATFLRTRFQRLDQSEDGEALFNLYGELAYIPQMVSSRDLVSAAKEWVHAAEHFHHPTIILAYETSLRLLTQHLATLPLLPRHLPVLKKLVSSLAADAFSACLRNCSFAKAVELLEQGRGVFWNQVTRLRSPLDDVTSSGAPGKTLANKFIELTSEIRDTTNSPGADQHDRLCRLNVDLQRVVNDIRALPGLSHFLLPSLFSDLQPAAVDGPIIIVNSSQYTCDALVVFADRDPVHIPLQVTKCRVRDLSLELQTLTLRAKTMDVTRDLAVVLREIWEEVVSPIVDFLRTTLPIRSRIWWCPTAEFTALPLHAAGPYRRNCQNLSDLYVSSYTPTLTALKRARRPTPSDAATDRTQLVAIGQREATGECELVSVGRELDTIGRRLKDIGAFTRIEGPESSLSRVSEELSKNEWVHFACHGLPNRQQPFESAFALYDGHFTIEHIMRCQLRNPQFAYLSACHTTVGDEDSPDEAIHLASAMHFAGFRSVIGTMWGVDDGQTDKITSMFYTRMTDESGRLDHTRAAFALVDTMKTVDVPFDQRILYIHIGA